MAALSIFWGNHSTSPVAKQDYRASFTNYQANFANIIVSEQNHGQQGHVITIDQVANWSQQPLVGDYLITNLKNVWLGALTADCLSIVFYDPINLVVAIAHAGWRGSVAGIAQTVFDKLILEFKINPADLQIFFGPSAGSCCYEVGLDFVAQLSSDRLAQACLKKSEQRYFFDVLLYNMLCLEKCGVPSQNFDLSGHSCTICNIEYCSYRRDQQATKLQLSLVALR